jgi:hypothetical protein
VNYIGVDNRVHELFDDGSWKHNDLSNVSGLFTTPLNGTPLAGYQTGFNDQQHVIFIATNLHTHELYF